MKRLIVFGCSNTFGEGLPDCGSQSNNWCGSEPSKLAWPDKLAALMGIDEVVNFGLGGQGNKCILNYVIEKVASGLINPDTDVVVILWSFFSRHCIFHDDGSIERFLPNDIKNFRPGNVKKRKSIKLMRVYKWYNNYHSFKDQHFENYTKISHARHYLNSKGIRYHGFTSETEESQQPKKWFDDKTLLPIGIVSILGSHGVALDQMHPSELGHSHIAEIMYKHITK